MRDDTQDTPAGTPPPAPAKRGWRGRLLLLLVSLAISLAVGEIAVRLLLGHRMVLFPRFHNAVTYGEYRLRRLRPDTVFWHTSVDGSWRFSINAQGFRADHDIPYAKPPGRLRVLVLGDSHTMGFEARQDRTYAAVIEGYLSRRGVDAEVINAGVSGFGTGEMLLFLENEGIRYAPDVVVLGFFANDLADNVRSDLFRVSDGKLVVHKREYAPGTRITGLLYDIGLFRWLSQNSYFYSALFNTVWEAAKNMLLSRKQAEIQREYAIPVGEVGAYPVELTGLLLERMHRFCREHGIPLILLDLPRIEKDSVGSSIPEPLQEAARAHCDVILPGAEIMRPYEGVADVFVPHGQRHIAELTHLMLGVRVAETILGGLAPAEP